MALLRACGSVGLHCSAQGLGCMGMSMFYKRNEDLTTQEEDMKVFDKCEDLGCTLLDTADFYGPFTNEELIGKAIRERREKFVISTKCGVKATPQGLQLDASPAFIKTSCEGSLKRLGVESLDLYYYNRRDPNTPVEETMRAMKVISHTVNDLRLSEIQELVEEGKVKYIGLSEIPLEDVRKAHAIHPISAIQLEWSLFTRDAEAELIPLCRELGIGCAELSLWSVEVVSVGIVAYSPLGRGFLTGEIQSVDDIPEGDYRRRLPRFTEYIEENLKLVEVVKTMAAEKGCTPGQLALAWLHAQGDDVFPIPGTTRVSRLEENFAAFNVVLTDKELEKLSEIGEGVKGDRYDEQGMKITFAG